MKASYDVFFQLSSVRCRTANAPNDVHKWGKKKGGNRRDICAPAFRRSVDHRLLATPPFDRSPDYCDRRPRRLSELRLSKAGSRYFPDDRVEPALSPSPSWRQSPIDRHDARDERRACAFIERNFHLTRRYWAWQIAFLVYSVAGALSISPHRRGLRAIGRLLFTLDDRRDLLEST